jgi:hypothetical protein
MANRRRDHIEIDAQAVATVYTPDGALNDTNGHAPGRARERQREAGKGSADNSDFRVGGVHHV